MAKSRREQMREELDEAIEESEQRKDDSGKFGDYFKDDADIVKWKCEKGQHIIDIIPYRAGENDPHRAAGKMQYVLDLWIHTNVGVTEDRVVCLSRNYKKPCPICEHQAELRAEEDYDEELVDKLNPKRRVIYNIICYDTAEEEDKGVQVWEVAYFFMEKKLLPLAKERRTGERIRFADPDNGKSVSFDVVDKIYGDKDGGKPRKGIDFEGHKLESRDYEILDQDLDDAHCLDEIIEILEYDEIHKMYWGEDADEQEPVEEEKPSRSRERGRSRSTEGESESGNKCTHGGSFGEDLNTMDECNMCDDYDDCFAKNKELKKKEEDDDSKEEQKEEKKTSRRGSRVKKESDGKDSTTKRTGRTTRRRSRRK